MYCMNLAESLFLSAVLRHVDTNTNTTNTINANRRLRYVNLNLTPVMNVQANIMNLNR